jgi:hypothetical protein
LELVEVERLPIDSRSSRQLNDFNVRYEMLWKELLWLRKYYTVRLLLFQPLASLSSQNRFEAWDISSLGGLRHWRAGRHIAR